MANQDQLALLKNKVERWNDWRVKNEERRNLMRRSIFAAQGRDPVEYQRLQAEFEEMNIDLSHADLSGLDLRGLDLRGANLSHAEMYSSDLRETNLSGADLSYANLSNCKMRGTILTGANMNKTDLTAVER